MSGLSILPDQVYGEESFESASRRSGGGGGTGGTKIPAASGQSYEDDDVGASASLSGCSSSGYEFDEEDDQDPHDPLGPDRGGDRYGREMRSLLKGLEDALDDSDFIAGGRGRTTSDRDRRRRKRGDGGFMSTREEWLIRPEFFCQYPRLLAAASKRSHHGHGASTLVRPTPPPQPSRCTSADRALVLPMHRVAGGGTGRAKQWKIRHSSAGGDAVASGEQRLAAFQRPRRAIRVSDNGRRGNVCCERRGHNRSGKERDAF